MLLMATLGNAVFESAAAQNSRSPDEKSFRPKAIVAAGGWTGSFWGQWLGIWGMYAVNRHGILADFKWSGDYRKGDDYYSNISVNRAENIFADTFLEERETAESIDIAYLLRITKSLAVYGGIGWTEYLHTRKYYDRFEILGSNGAYWVADPAKDHSETNVILGSVFHFTRKWCALLGYQTEPGSACIGIGYGLMWP